MKQFKKFKMLNKRQKAEFIIASVLSVSFLIALPSYAWFASNKNLETITKIKQPGDIIIRAGKAIDPQEADPIVNFEMKDIDIEKIADGTPQRFVFSVYPGVYRLNYNLQIAHTTNIPFTYKIYKATAPDTTGWTQAQIDELTVYTPATAPENKTYYQITAYNNNSVEIPMDTLNEDTSSTYGKTAKTNDNGDNHKCYSQTYYIDSNTGDGDDSDTPDIYAIPIYMQTHESITPHSIESNDEDDGYDYYILELGWEENDENASSSYKAWNEAVNNEETDIIYITAESSAG